MSNELLEQALTEIANDASLTAVKKMRLQAEVMKNHRAIYGGADRIIGVKNQTTFGKTFSQSVSRSLGRSLVKGLCGVLKGR